MRPVIFELVRLNFSSSNVISFWGIRARVLIKSETIEELNVNFTGRKRRKSQYILDSEFESRVCDENS